MKRRSVHNDPIGTTERDRGAVVQQFAIDLDETVPVCHSGTATPGRERRTNKAPRRK
ncbi:MAG TPA: hypothetical protein VGP02_16350 [Mycobacteriales bacterium]|jgi:hypothetical protein|nr:hypothetical protein [Mycobacteriales bacterium]